MKLVNLIVIALIIIIIGYEAYLILKRNRTVEVKGTDDFLVLMLFLLIILLLFPFNENELVEEAVRNLLAIVAVISSLFVKRGVNNKGLVKICFIVPWDKIESVIVEESKSSSKGIFHFYLKSGLISKWKLQFGLRQVEPALDLCANKVKNVKVEPELFQKIEKYKKMF